MEEEQTSVKTSYAAAKTPKVVDVQTDVQVSVPDVIKEGNGEIVSFMELFRYADRKDLYLMTLGTLFGFACGIGQPLQIIFFGDTVNAFNPNDDGTVDITSGINDIALKFVYLSIGIIVSGFGQVACWSISASRQSKRIKHHYVRSILSQNIGWFDVNEPQKLPTQVADSTLIIQDGIGRKVADGANFFAMGFGGIVIGIIKGWELSLVLLAFIPVIGFSAFVMAKALSTAVQGGSEAYGRAGAVAEETLANVRTVHAFNASDTMVKKYATHLEETEKSGVKKGLSIGMGTGFMFFTVFCSYALGMYYGTVLIIEDRKSGCTSGSDCYDGGRVLVVFFSIIMGAMALGMAGPSIQAMFMARAAAFKVFQVIDRASLIDPFSTQGLKLETLLGDVEFANISFAYPSRPEVTICKNYSLKVKAGEQIALVGSSGSGKSTVVSLLERFYDVNSGVVYIDGHDIRAFNVAWIRSKIGYVGQEPILFAGSIATNIGYGKPGGLASQAEIEAAARQANAYNFIMEFPDGFQTEVGERGTQLSGGQKQRIAIARAIIKDPSILLLDEATSALDTESERIVQESLDRVLEEKKRTTFIIAHRLTTIRGADRIAVHEEGQIVEIGSHDELVQANGRYKALLDAQYGGQDNGDGNGSSSPRSSKKMKDTEASNITKKSEKRSVPATSTTTSATTHLVAVPGTMEEGKKNKKEGGEEVNKDEEKDDDDLPSVPMSRIWQLNQPDRIHMFLGALGAAVNGITYPLWGVFLAKITVLFFKNLPDDEMKTDARWWALAFILLGTAYAVSVTVQNYHFAIVAERLTRRLRTLAFAAMLRQEMGWFDAEENSSGALTTRLATDSAIIQTITGDTLNRTLVTLFSIGGGFGIAFYYSWEMTLILIAVFPILSFGNYIQAEMMGGGVTKAKNEGDIKAGALVAESITSIRTVASFGLEKTMNEKYMAYLQESKSTDVRMGLVGGAAFGFAQGIMVASMAFLFWYGGRLVSKNSITFEDMFVVILSIFMASFGIGIATQNMTDASKAKRAARRVFGIIDRVPAIDSNATTGMRPEKVEGHIQLKAVDFAYPSRPEAQIYQSYSLDIHPGQTVALVGASGSGKSTAVSLVERFYDPSAGVVALDGRDVKSLNIQWLRQNISLVSQEPVLFSGTIAENIAFGKPSATREEIIRACKSANAHEFVSKFPGGYDTEVGDRGIQVSGGQKQRLALARAIIRDPAVLLLDEATSALDNESERIVQESLDTLLKLKKRTTIIIAHRLSTIRDADQIAVTENGRIVELGTYDELMGIENGVFVGLVSKQLGDH